MAPYPGTFQFHNGSIKSSKSLKNSAPRPSFNSTMVRLKVSVEAQLSGTPVMFQFHNGSIKSSVTPADLTEDKMFQFHNGSIKSDGRSIAGYAYYKFQFHNGSIKSQPSRKSTPVDIDVSIPQWFD